MSKKSVLGTGDEFGWVGNAKASEKDVSTDKSTSLQVDKSTGRQVDKSTNDSKSANKNRLSKRKLKTKQAIQSSSLQKIGLYLEPQTVLDLKMQALSEKVSVSALVQNMADSYFKRKKQN